MELQTTCARLADRGTFFHGAAPGSFAGLQRSNPLHTFATPPPSSNRTRTLQTPCRAGLTTVYVPKEKDDKKNARVWRSPQDSQHLVKQLLEHDTSNALADHFESKRADKGLWCTVADSERMRQVGIKGCKGLLLKRRSAENSWWVWIPSLGVFSLEEADFTGAQPTGLADGSGWTQEQAVLVLAGAPSHAARQQHIETVAAWWEQDAYETVRQWGHVRATPMTVDQDVAGMTGCVLSRHDDKGNGRGGWRTIQLPTHGIVTVQPSEFVEEEGILPPMLRPWWAVVRPTENAVDRGIAGGLALIFARSVGSRGKLERAIWWAWLPGRGFRKLTNGEVSQGCQDVWRLGSPDHLPISASHAFHH
eukprot:TRINITY_DN15653_c0_g1_i1.p1 TRINITY_DN15653_c0_g1~~TRINITY_DN15653_c0_g1_i1.p1  ORF type:complete len:363 (-),score=65.32 TRINITY_DN15653_c0_g1_i1:565-1653(-)